jgi:archaellum component FlaC
VLEGDAFAGEGLMDPIKPGEKRLLSYAADLGLLVDAKQKSERQKITKVVIAHGAMTQMTEEQEEHIYTIRNRDTSARTVVIEHPARPGWKLADGTEPAESTASFHRFRLDADPKKTTIVSVKEYRPISTRYELTNVSDDEIAFFVSQNSINAEVEKVLRRVVGQKNSIAAFDADIAARKAQVSGIAEDQKRVRENMKALKGSAEEKALLQRYARELNDQEDRVQSLQHEVSGLQQKRDAAQKALTEMIEGLELEATL